MREAKSLSREDEDPADDDDDHDGGKPGSSSIFTSVLHLFKSLVGIGILALPTAFYNSGWLAGLILLPVCAIAMLYVSYQIIDISNNMNTKAKNLVEFVRETIPANFLASLNICLLCFQIGICISYVIFFITYINSAFCNIDGNMFPCTSKVVSVIVSLVILIPLVMIKDMSKLKPWSLMGNLVTVTSLLIVSVYCIVYFADNQVSDKKVSMFNFRGIGNSIGVFIFTFEGTGVYFNVRYAMVEPKRFKTVLNLSLGLSMIMYCLVGLLGYLAFGNTVDDIILFSFNDDVIVIQVIKVAYCVALILTYPIQIFPCVSVAEIKLKNVLFGNKKKEQEPLLQGEHFIGSNNSSGQSTQQLNKKFKLGSIGIRLGYVLLTFLVGVFFDKVSDFISLTGDVCGIYLCYVIPVLIVYYQDKSIEPRRKFLNYIIVVVSIGFGIYGIYSTILQIITDFF